MQNNTNNLFDERGRRIPFEDMRVFNEVSLSYYKLNQPEIEFEKILSNSKQFADIDRSKSIIVRYTNEDNNIIEEKKDGMEARILQHEIDHLSGKLFIDFLSSLKRNMLIKKVQKLKKMGEI